MYELVNLFIPSVGILICKVVTHGPHDMICPKLLTLLQKSNLSVRSPTVKFMAFAVRKEIEDMESTACLYIVSPD